MIDFRHNVSLYQTEFSQKDCGLHNCLKFIMRFLALLLKK